MPPIGTTVTSLHRAFHPLSGGDASSFDRNKVRGIAIGSKCSRRSDSVRSRRLITRSAVEACFAGSRAANWPTSFNVLNADIKITAEIKLCHRLGGPEPRVLYGPVAGFVAEPIGKPNSNLGFRVRNLRNRLSTGSGLTALVSISPRKPTRRPRCNRRRVASIATRPPNEYPANKQGSFSGLCAQFAQLQLQPTLQNQLRRRSSHSSPDIGSEQNEACL